MKTTILILLTAVSIAVVVVILCSWNETSYHKDEAGFTVNDYFPNCSDGTLCSFDGIPYDCVNGKWVVNKEILAEVKRQGYYTKEELQRKYPKP